MKKEPVKPLKIIIKENKTDPDMYEFITHLPSGRVVVWGTIFSDMFEGEWVDEIQSNSGQINCEMHLIEGE